MIFRNHEGAALHFGGLGETAHFLARPAAQPCYADRRQGAVSPVRHCTGAPVFRMPRRATSLQPQRRLFLLHVIASYAIATAEAPLPSACHCEPVRTLAWQSASPGRNVVHCTCARLRAHLPSLSLHTSAHTGVAIRFPAAAESGKQHFRRIRNCPRIRPKHCSFSLSLRVKRIAPLLRSLQ